jgi:3-phenylpropionate/trans-cinnamate dioxygenase ferredoxin reductase component
MTRTVLVVGAGLAGSRCAETLRAEGFGGRIVLVGKEPVPPYERPALSKDVLTGVRSPERIWLRPDSHWEEQGVELLLSTVVERVDTLRRHAVTADGRVLHWDALVLATGARARRPAATLPRGVHVLRTLPDSLALRRELGPGRRLAVVGAGFTGGEVASAAAWLGSEVIVVDGTGPLVRALGPEVGRLMSMRYANLGIELITGARLTHLRVGPDGRFRGLVLTDGREVRCDCALLAVGADPVTPRGAPGQSAGIPTDSSGRTSVPWVYACGDVSLAWHPRLERRFGAGHWTAAAGQAVSAARAILGRERPYDDPPYFWSDQTGLRLQCVGLPDGYASAEIVGESDSFTVRYLARDGRMLAALFANRPREAASLRKELAA